MKQVRRISNLIAEELISAGYDENSSLFESKISEIIDMIDEAVDNIEEEAEVESVYMATSDWTLGGIDIVVGDFVEVDDITDDGAEVTIYDEDGEVKAEEITVTLDEIDDFADNSEEVEVELDEAKVSFAGGKKHKVSNKEIAMKAKGKGKNFFMKRVNGKWTKVKVTPEMKKAMRMNAKKNFKGAARKKAQKTLKKTRRANEGFDINVNGMNVAVEEGDILVFEGNKVTVIREGNVVISGIAVSESFLSRCVDEGVIEGKDCGYDEDEDTDEEAKPADKKDAGSLEEGAVLTFRSGKGYILVKEGSEYVMGNRVRARAMLSNQGFNVGARELDRAADGNVVIL